MCYFRAFAVGGLVGMWRSGQDTKPLRDEMKDVPAQSTYDVLRVFVDACVGQPEKKGSRRRQSMNGLYTASLLICASLATESPDQWLATGRLPLHAHPTIVAMWQHNNAIRQRVGLPAHRLSPELTRAAQDHANYMARTGDFDHYSNRGPWGRALYWGYRGSVCENIAMGQGTVTGAFAAWQASRGHWANLTSSTVDAGFGFALSPGGTPYWVAVYGYGAPSSQDQAESGSTAGSR
jgi:hypothetical protein